MPGSLIGRIALWAALLLLLAVVLFWALFGAAAGEVSREVVDTRLVQFAEQVRGYWASRQAEGRVGDAGAPNPNPVLGSPDVGWVWQISEGGTVVDRSQLLRLTGATLRPSVTRSAEEFVLADRETPLGPMRIAERVVNEVPPFARDRAGKAAPVHYLVGMSAEQYRDDVEQHIDRLRPLFLLALLPVTFAVIGMLAAILLALRRDLGRVSTAIGRYEASQTNEIEGRFPSELQRLVDRVNGLLQQNLMLIDRTRKYVSKIAHDVNHPLAIMKNALDRPEPDRDVLKRQVARMTGLVDRYSSLARAIGPDSAVQRRTNVGEVLADVAEGFSIVYRRTPLEIRCSCDPELVFPVARHDLEAIVSNLVSNAHKFAERNVEIGAVETKEEGNGEAAGLTVWVADDGPGISPESRDAALHWGGRLDEAPPGTGFGLAIVADIVALYNGGMRLGDSESGGLKVEIRLPR